MLPIQTATPHDHEAFSSWSCICFVLFVYTCCHCEISPACSHNLHKSACFSVQCLSTGCTYGFPFSECPRSHAFAGPQRPPKTRAMFISQKYSLVDGDNYLTSCFGYLCMSLSLITLQIFFISLFLSHLHFIKDFIYPQLV